jgi:hypothetical protein
MIPDSILEDLDKAKIIEKLQVYIHLYSHSVVIVRVVLVGQCVAQHVVCRILRGSFSYAAKTAKKLTLIVPANAEQHM